MTNLGNDLILRHHLTIIKRSGVNKAWDEPSQSFIVSNGTETPLWAGLGSLQPVLKSEPPLTGQVAGDTIAIATYRAYLPYAAAPSLATTGVSLKDTQIGSLTYGSFFEILKSPQGQMGNSVLRLELKEVSNV